MSDGKVLGSLKRLVVHLSESDIQEDNKSILGQITHFKDRIFLSVKKERALLCKLLSGEISMEDFTFPQQMVSW